jgi:hypothetical protein
VHLSANEPRKITSRRHALPWDWISGVLLLLALYLAGGRLVATEWTENLFTIQILGCVAVAFGLLLGRTRFPGWVALILATGYGLVIVPVQLSTLASDSGDWLAQLSYIGTRMAISVGEFVNRENVSDPILFLAVMALVIWGLAVWAGYRLARRGDAWGATLPMGALLVILQTYDNAPGTRSLYLAAYVLCILLLVSRQQLLRQQLNWEHGRIQVPMYIGVDLLFAALGAGALIVLLAWATPALASPIGAAENAWSELTRPWRSLREDFSRAFYPLESTTRDEGDYYGEALALGRGNALSNVIQFTVQLLNEQQSVTRYYWRDRVYDHYENGEWQISFDQEQQMLADGAGLPVPALESQQVGQFRFTTAKPINLLHTAPQPLDVNRNVFLTYAENPDGSLDLAALRTASQLQIGDSYDVASLLTATSEAKLRAAGEDYPSWVTERYLQVPEAITQRTRDLAAQLAEGLDNNYDIAQTITRYLRTTIEYQDTVPSPPANSEPIDWVLFEEPRGFCNYYASAQVILLRVLGIPARLAVGYAQGDRQSINLVGGEPGEDRLDVRINDVTFYTVRQRDAHAWPEVYFPNIGWVEFEPTANQQELSRLEISEQAQDANIGALDEPPAEDEGEVGTGQEQTPEDQAARVIRETFQQQAVQGLLLLSIVALLGFAMLSKRFATRDTTIDRALPADEANPLDTTIRRALLRRAHQERIGPLERSYNQINSALIRLGAAPKAGHTPGERAAALAMEVPELGAELMALAGVYQLKLYRRTIHDDEFPGWRLRIQLQFAVWRNLINKRIRQFRDWWHSLNPFTRPLL